MPIDNEVIMEAIGEVKRRAQFRETVEQHGAAIEDALRKTAVKIWGAELPVTKQTGEYMGWSMRNYQSEKGWETLWYIINRQRKTQGEVVQQYSGRTQTVSYEAVAASLLNPINGLSILAIGRSAVSSSLMDGSELLNWDNFRSVKTTLDGRSLNGLMKKYVAHGPSKLSSTIYLSPGQKK